MTTLDRKPIPVSDTTVELEFRVRDDRCFLIHESERADCELVLDEVVPQSSGNHLEFVSVYGGAAEQVLDDALAWPGIADARILVAGETSLLELVVTEPCLTSTIADSRAIPRVVTADRGVGRVIVEVPPRGDPQRVVDLFRERHPESTLVARRQHEGGPLFSTGVFRERVLAGLTEKQRETLLTAHELGYFDRPRQISAVDCADALGISQSTFSQHLGVALQKTLDAVLAD
jgi:predicted DNA binding protein